MDAASFLLIATLASPARAEPSLILRDPSGGSAVLWLYPLPDLGQAQGVESSCTLSFQVKPGGPHSLLRAGCGEPLASVLTGATSGWTFVSVEPAAGQEAVEVEVTVLASPPETGGWRLGLSGEGMVDADVLAVEFREVRVLERVIPKMPSEALAQGIAEAKCALRFFVDAQGVPYDIRAEDCPELYVASAMEAAWHWRFEPMLVGNTPTRAQFRLTIVYRNTAH